MLDIVHYLGYIWHIQSFSTVATNILQIKNYFKKPVSIMITSYLKTGVKPTQWGTPSILQTMDSVQHNTYLYNIWDYLKLFLHTPYHNIMMLRQRSLTLIFISFQAAMMFKSCTYLEYVRCSRPGLRYWFPLE
jgi:hypothetical protein